MSKDVFNPYTSDSERRGTPPHADRRLPPLHEILGDVLDRPLSPGRRPPRRALNLYERGREWNEMGQAPSDSSPNNTFPSSGSSIAHPHASTSLPQPPTSSGRRPSRRALNLYERGREWNEMGQAPSDSSPNNTVTFPSSGSSIAHPHASTSQPQPPTSSSSLLNHSPDQDLVHQRTSACDDLETPDPSRKHACAECGKRFIGSSNLKDHLTTHSGERPFACTVCGRPFSLKHNMRKHMRTIHNAADDGDQDGLIHQRTSACDDPVETPKWRPSTSDPPRKHACAECGKRYISPWHLKYHLLIHSGERPFACTHCGRTFNKRSKMRSHMRTAHKPAGDGDQDGLVHQSSSSARDDLETPKWRSSTSDPSRKHVCAECGMRFIRPYHLKRHLITHSDERLFACTHCGRTFSEAGDVRRHMRTVHKRLMIVIEIPQQGGEHNPQVAKDPLVMIDGRPVVDTLDHNIALFTRPRC